MADSRPDGSLAYVELIADGSSGNIELERSMAELLERLFELFKKKQASYGPRNISDLGGHAVFVRMYDKLMRLRRLIWEGKANNLQDETVDDTLLDLADYSLIMILVRSGLWPEVG